MAKSIKQIQQELKTLESSVEEAGRELKDAYARYLELLSQSAKQQLILACYQLCTQVYPEFFLSLSLSQKQELQQKLRTLGREIQPQITNCAANEEIQPVSVQRELDLLAEMVKKLPITPTDRDKLAAKLNFGSANSSSNISDIEEIETEEIFLPEEEPDSSEPPQKLDLKNPEHLFLWHKQVEKTIKKTLDDISEKANKCLQEAAIIPSRLPAKIIEVAIQADEASSSSGDRQVKKSPNILSLAIETEKEKKSKPQNIQQFELLRLRLAEIEFADPRLNVRRNQVRSVVGKIAKLRQRFGQLKEEYTVAEAEAAWRSTWYED
ncbi:hypothetical protein [Myxosarcina sp. GI1]|uniref:hypothetical protein n=1 Tax=Myxosarcina sp. GI1 TaxID=1541065 RepID=UPI000561BA46|nr:hypothetical protein [Myxosarcina sp. GI1]